MQLIWIGGPAQRVVTFSWTKRRLVLLAVLFSVSMMAAGAALQWVGLRVAVEYMPAAVRTMGGVISQTQMQKLEEKHTQQVLSLQERMSRLQTQLRALQNSKSLWLESLGWKTNLPVSGEKQPVWVRSGGQGGPFRLMSLPEWAKPSSPLASTQEALYETEKTVAWMNQAWPLEQETLEKLPLSIPLAGEYAMTSRFGARADPMTHSSAFHEGLDLIGPWRSEVQASAPGRVLRAQSAGAYGQLVEIEHANHYVTRYAHLDHIAVKTGDWVVRGQKVGLMGNTGRSTGPHLHYEVLYKNQPINPELPLQAFWQDLH